MNEIFWNGLGALFESMGHAMLWYAILVGLSRVVRSLKMWRRIDKHIENYYECNNDGCR